MIDAMGGRKLLALLVAVAIGVGLVFLKGDVPSGFLELLKYGLGFFVAGNAVEHAVASRQASAAAEVEEGSSEEAPAGVSNELLSAQLDAVRGDLARTQEGVSLVQQTLEAIIKRAYGTT